MGFRNVWERSKSIDITPIHESMENRSLPLEQQLRRESSHEKTFNHKHYGINQEDTKSTHHFKLFKDMKDTLRNTQATTRIRHGSDALRSFSKSARAMTLQTTSLSKLRQLFTDTSPRDNSARVIRQKYQSITRERDIQLVDMDGEKDAIEMYEIEFKRHDIQVQGDSMSNNAECIAVEQENDTGKGDLGIELETDFYGKHAVVKEVKRHSPAYPLSKTHIMAGHIVVAVNGKDLSQLSFQEVLQELRDASYPKVIRFLNPQILPIENLQHEEALVNRDQFGFAKDDKYILSYRKQLRKKKHALYTHEKRWMNRFNEYGGLDQFNLTFSEKITMAKDSEKFFAQERSQLVAELRPLVLQGIPTLLRGRVWSLLANVNSYKCQYPKDYFNFLKQNISSSPSIIEIDKDICRTYPEHPFFQINKGQQELKTVLGAYSLHNPMIGYCQSMNFLAGMMLLFMDEEDAFWLLTAIMGGQYLPAENYCQSMVGMQTDQLVFTWLVNAELPEIAKKFQEHAIPLQLITLPWFLCVFVCTLPTETVLRVWDWFFMDGEEVLFIASIGILKLAEESILKAETHSELHAIAQELGTDLHDEDAFMNFLYRISDTDVNGDISCRKSSWCSSLASEDSEFAYGSDDSYVTNDDTDDLFHRMKYSDRTSCTTVPSSTESSTIQSPQKRSNSIRLPSSFQEFLALLDTDSKKKTFVRQYTIADIKQKRIEIRKELEEKALATAKAKLLHQY